MNNYAIIDQDGTVENIVVADSIENAHVPAGRTILLAGPNAEVGGTHDGTAFVRILRPAPAPSVPDRISKLQLVRALRLAGHWGGVKAAIAQSDTVTKEDWDYAYKINRDDPMMETFAGALDLTPADVDALFISGATL